MPYPAPNPVNPSGGGGGGAVASVEGRTGVVTLDDLFEAYGSVAALVASGVVLQPKHIAKFVFSGGGSALTPGPGKVYLTIPFAGTITAWKIFADQSGSIQFDVWKAAFSTSTDPTVANTITASAKPILSSALNATSSTLTGWTTAVTAGDVLEVNIDSATTVTKVTLELSITETT